MKKQKLKKNKTPVQKAIDLIIAFPFMIFPVWLFAFVYVSGISGSLFLIVLCSSLLLMLVSKLVLKFKKGQKLLYIALGISFCAWIAFYLPVLLLMNFSHTKPLYALKRADYIYGVHNRKALIYEELLPEKLPDICEDYSYRTYGTLPVQDYSASSYLMFHTDTATLDSYAEHFDSMEHLIRHEKPAEEEYDDQEKEYSGFQNDLEWFCGQMRLRQSFQDNLDHAILYRTVGYYPKMVLLNRETGLVAIMT